MSYSNLCTERAQITFNLRVLHYIIVKIRIKLIESKIAKSFQMVDDESELIQKRLY